MLKDLNFKKGQLSLTGVSSPVHLFRLLALTVLMSIIAIRNARAWIQNSNQSNGFLQFQVEHWPDPNPLLYVYT